MTSLTGDRRLVSRAGYGASALAFALFLIYGSVVPLDFRSMSFERALAEFSSALAESVHIDSNSDFVSNILLGVPLGYLLLAAAMTDRIGWLRRLLAAAAVLPCSIGISVLAEFLQVFAQGRTNSLNDIVAQSIGAVVGVSAWMIAGDTVTDWLRASLAEREPQALFNRFLLGYCVLFAIYQVMPLDLTINLGQLAEKYRNGGVLLRPFAYPYASRFDMYWDYGTDVLLNAPMGVAAVLLWTRPGTRRSLVPAVICAMVAIAAIEFAQVFVRSRFADVTDLITGGVGVVLGACAASAFSRRESLTSPREGIEVNVQLARLAVVAWIAILTSYHWNPFDFTFTPSQVSSGMHSFLAAPFSWYYEGSEFHALTEAVRKALMALPLGVLLRLSWHTAGIPGRDRLRQLAAAIFGLCVLMTIEVGQAFLPSRVSDITDALIGEAGLLVGLWIASRLMTLGARQRVVSPLTRERRP